MIVLNTAPLDAPYGEIDYADRLRRVAAAIETGATDREIAERLHCPRSLVWRVRTRAQALQQPPHPKHDAILRRLVVGARLQQIATEFGVSIETVRDVRRRAGLPSRAVSVGRIVRLIARELKLGRSPVDIAARHNLPEPLVAASADVLTARPLPPPPTVKSNTASERRLQRIARLRELAASSHTTVQIAAAIGVSTEWVWKAARESGVVIHADRVVTRQRVDANRVVAAMTLDAEHLTADVGLIDFSALDRRRLAGWVRSLQQSRRALSKFIAQLVTQQEQNPYDHQKSDQTPVED